DRGRVGEENDVAEAALTETEQPQREAGPEASQAVFKQPVRPYGPGNRLGGRRHARAGRQSHSGTSSKTPASSAAPLSWAAISPWKMSEIVDPSSSSGTR